jgi:hypothetical protein
MPGPRERRLAVDHPLDVPQRADEALEPALVGEPGMRVEELQLAGAVCVRKHRQHLAAEQARQHASNRIVDVIAVGFAAFGLKE